MDFVELFSKIGILQSFMQDFFLLIIIALLTVVVVFFVGRRRLVPLFLSSYVALALLDAFPGKYLDGYQYELAFFFVILVLFTVFGKKIISTYVSKSDFMWRIIVLSFLEVTAISSIVFSILPKKITLSYISQNAYNYLVSSNFHFFWLVLPLIFIYLIRKRLN